MMNTSRSLLWGMSASAALLLGTAHAAPPAPNEVQAKYLDFVESAGGYDCKAKGKLGELQGEPYKCYLDLDECKASVDAVGGKLDPAFVTLFADLLVQEPGEKVAFKYSCPGRDGPKFLEGLGIQGLGYAKATDQLEKLLALGTPEKLKSFSGAAQRELLVNALVHMGAGQKDKTDPVLVNLVKAEAKTLSFKAVALQGLARHGNDGAADYCLEQLKGGESKDLHQACMLYLGERKVAAALPVLERAFEKNEEVAARAMGLLGDKGAVATLEKQVEERGSRLAQPAVVALINLGKEKEYLPKLLAMIEGKAPLTAKEEEKKKEELGKAKKPKDTERVKKKWDERESKVDQNIAQSAAMESTYVTNAAVEKKLADALKAATKSKEDKEWKVRVYATLALAQRGDKAAASEAAKLLSDNKEEVRLAVLNAAGGLYGSPGATFGSRGRGMIADASLVPALLTFIENEPKLPNRVKALHAIAAVKSAE